MNYVIVALCIIAIVLAVSAAAVPLWRCAEDPRTPGGASEPPLPHAPVLRPRPGKLAARRVRLPVHPRKHPTRSRALEKLAAGRARLPSDDRRSCTDEHYQ
jgi:hypothetical protein